MRSILYISLTGMTEALGRSQVLEYLMDLSKDNKIFLVSFERTKDLDMLNDIKSMTEEQNIKWQYMVYSNKYGVFSTIGQIVSTIIVGSKIIKKNNIDIIHARSMIPAVMGFVLKKIYDVKLLFDIRGFAIDEKSDSGRLNEDSFMFKTLKKLDNYLYRSSDHIVTLTNAAKEVLHENLQISYEKITTIPTCANKEIFKIMDQHEMRDFRRSLGVEDNDKIIIHTGTVINRYDFALEVKLFKALISQDDSFKFLIVNKGEHEYIKNIMFSEGIDDRQFLIRESRFDEMYKYLNISDFSMFFIPPSFAKKAMAPTKFAENVACRLPSITNAGVGDMGYYLDKYKVGKVVDLAQAEESAAAVAKELLVWMEVYELEEEQYEKLFSEHFDKEMAVRKYDEIYGKI